MGGPHGLHPARTPYLPVTLAPGVQSLADLDLQPTRRRHVVAPIGHVVGEVALARGVAAGLVVRIPIALAVADILHQAGRRVAQMQGDFERTEAPGAPGRPGARPKDGILL